MPSLKSIFRRNVPSAGGNSTTMRDTNEPRPFPLIGKLPRNKQLALTGGTAIVFLVIATSTAVFTVDRDSRVSRLSQVTDTLIADLQRLSRELQRVSGGESRNIDDIDSTGRVISLGIEELQAGGGSSAYRYADDAAAAGRLYADGAASEELISFQLKQLKSLYTTKLGEAITRLTKSKSDLEKMTASTQSTRETAQRLDDRLEDIYILGLQSGYPASILSSITGARASLANVSRSFTQAATDPRATIRQVQGVPSDVKTIASAVATLKEMHDKEIIPARLQPQYVLDSLAGAETDSAALTKASAELFALLGPVLEAKGAALATAPVIDDAYVYAMGLKAIYVDEDAKLVLLYRAATGCAILGTLFLFLMFVANARESRRQAYLAKVEYETSEESIQAFFNVVRRAKAGDLTTEAKVVEGATGAVSDAFNMFIEALRSTLTTIRQNLSRVSANVVVQNDLVATVRKLAAQQKSEMNEAAQSVSRIRDSAQKVASIADGAAGQARNASHVVGTGSDAVSRTIETMGNIAQEAQRALKLTKRVAERSQEVGEITTVLHKLHEHIRVLALNAEVEAKRAGEHGAGFGVVAEEIQKMSKDVGLSLGRIERIITATVSETNEAVEAVDKAVSKVVDGTKLARDSGEALQIINAETGKLVESVLTIAEVARQQATSTEDVDHKVEVVKQLGDQMVTSAERLAKAANEIQTNTSDLNKSVSVFKTAAANDERLVGAAD